MQQMQIDLELLERASKATGWDLCDHCLGRLFAHVSTGMTNSQRGKEVRQALSDDRERSGLSPYIHPSSCFICQDVFDSTERFAQAAITELQKVEYDTFLIGTRVDPLIVEREEQVWAVVGKDTVEPIKAELNQEIGKRVEALTTKAVEFKTPDVVALVDTRFAHVELDVAPLFLYARYHKYSREIPQTYWPCRSCRGKGCPRCQGTGKMYQTSVQEIIGEPIMQAAEGKDHFFHGMGREDIDARMLGNGRPFVIEIRDPKKRHLDLLALQKLINEQGEGRVDITPLRPSSREEVRQIKDAAPNKAYRVVIGHQGKVNKDKVVEVLRAIDRTCISQQTPSRVQHRRADLERAKVVLSAELEQFGPESMTVFLRTQSGTYVKEFVHGDEGRTRPSLSALLGTDLSVLALDVVEISDNNEG